ncbi:Ycf51 family protein [filamentous cyanobacterium LEGE 11480]|uniref:Ycf51 family protein n=1 Tax=Romeriopsis navalis LEGE 11480 TaxID=2777977 RepID=A0A928Z4S3_9CYAN|nr:Ycf51 family protein [Romeriopsis navalis]MBE9032926.1 Ycf51 family protein [Romeriopsis navalis LEGE 11480]
MTFSPADLQTYALWIAYAGAALVVLTIVAWILKWGWRFRLVGVTSFTFVVAASVFALSLSFTPRVVVPGTVRYARVFDRQSDQAVIAVPATVTEAQLEATLRQAAIDLSTASRTSPDGMLTIRARTVVHTQPGLSLPLYLGQVQRSLETRGDADMQIDLYPDNLALLPKVADA